MSLEQLRDEERFAEPIGIDGWTVHTNGKALFAVPGDGIEDSVHASALRGFLKSPDGMLHAKLSELKAFLGEPEWIVRERCKKNPNPNVFGECCYECDDYPDCEGGEIVTYPKSRPVVIGERVFDGNLVAQFLSHAGGDEIRWKDVDDVLYIDGEGWKVRAMAYREDPSALKHFP